MRVGRPEQQSNIIRHLAHEFPSGPPRDVAPVAYSRERCPTGMRHAAEHFEVRVLPCDTSVSLIVVDDALGVFRMHINPELRQGRMLFCTRRSHAHWFTKYQVSGFRRGRGHLARIADAPLSRGLERREIFSHLQSISFLREWGEALGACENFRRAEGASYGDAPYSEGLDRYGTRQFYVKHNPVERMVVVVNRVEGKVS